jgi:hypothetical protein
MAIHLAVDEVVMAGLVDRERVNALRSDVL